MRLTFKKTKSIDGTTEQVYPIVVETGEEIDDVKECIVSSSMDGLTTMTFTVNVLVKEFVEYGTKIDLDVKLPVFDRDGKIKG